MAVIEVKDIRKKFKLYYDKGNSLKEKLLFRHRRHYEEHWVLKGISFEAKKGEAIGLIGENGCGKSTLLKLMSRIMYPDSGSIAITGRVSSLIELGAGFHPNMSGRENIYTNAAIFGLTRHEIEKRLEAIIDFSELGDYIDNPVRTYSSGMYMRLAFSVAINVDADVLLIDEILAVGDANFQAKCFEKLRELKAAGVTIVIVTHDMSTVENFCTRALWLNGGLIQAQGKSSHVVDAYLAWMNDKHYEQVLAQQEKETRSAQPQTDAPLEIKLPEESTEDSAPASNEENTDNVDDTANRFGLRYIEITHAEMLDSADVVKGVFKSDEPVKIAIHYKVTRPIDGYVFGFSFSTLDGVYITGSNTQLDRLEIPAVKDSGIVELSFPQLPLTTGKYILQLAVVDNNGRPMDFYRDYSHFEIMSKDRSVGVVTLPHTWKIG